MGIKVDDDASQVSPSVLDHGFTTTDLPNFIREFKRRLERLGWLHDRIRGPASSADDLRTFIHQARKTCNLSLARYLLTPQEVVAYIQPQVRRSKGVNLLSDGSLPHAESEAVYTFAQLPAYEQGILNALCATSDIYWVAETTPSHLYGLVEYPLTTVVLVVKPPGSDVEFEVKRAGVRGPSPLQIVYQREGQPVPAAHRLHGAGMGRALAWEANSAALFSRLYRAIHNAEAPLPTTIALSAIDTVPVDGGDVSITNYFMDPRLYGGDFRAMRTAMAQAVAAFDQEHDYRLPNIPGEIGQTLKFTDNSMIYMGL